MVFFICSVIATIHTFLCTVLSPFCLPQRNHFCATCPFLFVTHCNEVAVLESQLFACAFIMSSRSHAPIKGFAFSPDKDQCTYCGRVVVAGPMDLSRHLARNPDCQLEYSLEHNASCQQSSTGVVQDTLNRQESDDVFIHTYNRSLSGFNPTILSLSEDQVACHPHEVDISNNEPVDDDDYSFDEHVLIPHSECVVGESFVLPNAECTPVVPLEACRPTQQPPSDLGTDACADSSILDAFIAPSESLNDGLSLSLFSAEEKVQVNLLQTLKRLRAPMIAYDEIMKWAVRSSLQGHVFRDVPLSSRKTVVKKLKVRVDLDALRPVVKELYLPYSKRFVKVVYFSAHAVFGSFLSCCELNQDQNDIFNDENDPDCNPFAKPNGAMISDINTGRCYRRTYDQLVKNPEDMLLVCILAIDKTTCDIGGGGRLSLEPIVVSYGLMDLDALRPVVKELYLPYSKRFVEVVYFSAHAVFGSFLSCCELNQDQNDIFNDENDPDCNPFAKPNGAMISDINTGRCYRRTYNQLVKNPEDMLLVCILAIDKTTCDIGGGGRLSLEPIAVSYGLMDLDALRPVVKELYLPNSKRFVEVVYFSAHAVFGSFLSCCELNQDQNDIFNDENDPDCNPFAKPDGAMISDINTGRCYRRTYDQLVKNPEDMLLACILAIDKTTCDIGGGGRLSLEPIVVSYGLMDLDALRPVVKELYLPYSKRFVEVVYFSAHAVFGSFLSCCELNQDQNDIFNDENDPDCNPFAKPNGAMISDINTGRCYRRSYDQLVKNPEDMLLACILAIDKTTCDIGGGGRLSLEPIVVSYGLMKHDIRKTPLAMRVLGFINTSPIHQRNSAPTNRPAPCLHFSNRQDYL